jgi:lysophospholipase L1-like esterase
MKKVILSLTDEPLEKRLAKEDIVYRVDSEDFYENLKEMIKLCREGNISPVVLTSPIPNLKSYYPSGMKSMMHQYHEFYNDLARIAALESEATMIDIAKGFDQYTDLYDDAPRDPIHFNAKGHGIAAELIYEYFKQDPEILKSCRR